MGYGERGSRCYIDCGLENSDDEAKLRTRRAEQRRRGPDSQLILIKLAGSTWGKSYVFRIRDGLWVRLGGFFLTLKEEDETSKAGAAIRIEAAVVGIKIKEDS